MIGGESVLAINFLCSTGRLVLQYYGTYSITEAKNTHRSEICVHSLDVRIL